MSKKNKKQTNQPLQYYELILFYQGGVVEKLETTKFATYKGEFERMDAVAKSNPLYELVVNMKDFNHEFEKRIY